MLGDKPERSHLGLAHILASAAGQRATAATTPSVTAARARLFSIEGPHACSPFRITSGGIFGGGILPAALTALGLIGLGYVLPGMQRIGFRRGDPAGGQLGLVVAASALEHRGAMGLVGGAAGDVSVAGWNKGFSRVSLVISRSSSRVTLWQFSFRHRPSSSVP